MISDTTIEIGSLISRTADIRGGRPVVAGTGVSVMRIAGFHQMGMEAEDIVAQLPHLSAAQVHAALAHYYANRSEIDQELETESREFDRLSQSAGGSGPA